MVRWVQCIHRECVQLPPPIFDVQNKVIVPLAQWVTALLLMKFKAFTTDLWMLLWHFCPHTVYQTVSHGPMMLSWRLGWLKLLMMLLRLHAFLMIMSLIQTLTAINCLWWDQKEVIMILPWRFCAGSVYHGLTIFYSQCYPLILWCPVNATSYRQRWHFLQQQTLKGYFSFCHFAFNKKQWKRSLATILHDGWLLCDVLPWKLMINSLHSSPTYQK